MFIDRLPVTRWRRVYRRRLKDSGRDTVCEGSVNNVTVVLPHKESTLPNEEKNIRVPGDPTDISHASELIVRVHIKDIFDRQSRAEKIASGSMYDTLRLPGGTGSLMNIKGSAESLWSTGIDNSRKG